MHRWSAGGSPALHQRLFLNQSLSLLPVIDKLKLVGHHPGQTIGICSVKTTCPLSGKL